MQGRRSLKPHLESPLDKTPPRLRKILESIDSPSIMDFNPSSSSTHESEPNNPDMIMAQFGQSITEKFELMLKNQQDFYERRIAQMMEQRENHVGRAPMKTTTTLELMYKGKEYTLQTLE